MPPDWEGEKAGDLTVELYHGRLGTMTTRSRIDRSHQLILITEAACDQSRATINHSRALLVEIRAARRRSAPGNAEIYLPQLARQAIDSQPLERVDLQTACLVPFPSASLAGNKRDAVRKMTAPETRVAHSVDTPTYVKPPASVTPLTLEDWVGELNRSTATAYASMGWFSPPYDGFKACMAGRLLTTCPYNASGDYENWSKWTQGWKLAEKSGALPIAPLDLE